MTIKLFTLVFTTLCFSTLIFGQNKTPTPTPSPTESPDEDVVRISSQLVLIDTLVLDKKGKQVTDLSADDFEILQDGKLQKITNFGYVNSDKNVVAESPPPKNKSEKKIPLPPISVRGTNQGRIITFVIDDGNCLATIGGLATAKDGMKKFINEQMLPDDKVAIYRTRGGSSLLQMYTSNKEVLKRIVDKVQWFPSGCGSAFEATKNDSTFKAARRGADGNAASTGKDTFDSKEDKQFKENIANEQRFNQVVGSLGVLSFVIERLKNLPQRKIVFLISEGIYAPSGSRAFDSLREVSDKAARSSVVVYTMSEKGVTIPGLFTAEDGGPPDENVRQARINEENELNNGLAYLADLAGGTFIRSKNFLETGIKEVLENETGYYLLGYQPDDETFSGKNFHKIEVKLKRPDLTIVSRKGFFGRADTKTQAKSRSSESPLYQAISSPFQENGIDLRLTTLVGSDAQEGNYIRALFHIKGEDLTFTDELNGMKKTVLDVVIVTLDEKGKLVDEYNRTYPIRIPKEGVPTVIQNGLDYSTDMPIKKPGVYSFRLAVRDNNSKRLGSAGDYVEIPDVKKGNFFMSGLFTTAVTGDNKPLLTKKRPAETAFAPVFFNSIPSIRQYSAGSVLAYVYNIYNAKLDNATKQPNLTKQIRLYKNGKLLSEGAEQPLDLQPQSDLSRIQDYDFLRLNEKLETGEYILQMIIFDKSANKTTSQFIDFEVVK